ncbi:uncharacterized protein LOC114930786 [Nylanderia fulva]|uniref:uncharacterized protein LOC114930786 n=1 Tax=Nylanderia fulva TaxID=613905 RepID=UPI0010FB9D6A|nr:uncharacterized protein LOC114930786 [Nylanderia fulva]
MEDSSENVCDEDPSYESSNNSSNNNFVEPVIDQTTSSVAKQTNSSANISSLLSILNTSDIVTSLNISDISTSVNISDIDIQDEVRNLDEDKCSCNWHGNVLEVYKDCDLFEPTIVEDKISKHSEISAPVSTTAYLNNNNIIQDISKNIYDKNPPYVSNTEENFIQSVDETTKYVTKEYNMSSTSLNISDIGIQDDDGNLNEACLDNNTMETTLKMLAMRIHLTYHQTLRLMKVSFNL